jgi:hypothetical protein
MTASSEGGERLILMIWNWGLLGRWIPIWSRRISGNDLI